LGDVASIVSFFSCPCPSERRSSGEMRERLGPEVGRCRLTVKKPVLKHLCFQCLNLQYHEPLSNFAFNSNLRPYTQVGVVCHTITRAVTQGVKSVAVGRALHSSTFRPKVSAFWDRGCIQGLCEGCLGGVRGYQGVLSIYFVSETAKVE